MRPRYSRPSKPSRLAWMQQQLLHAPVQELRHVQLVLGRTAQAVYPAELPGYSAGTAEPAENATVECELIDAAGIGIRCIQVLRRPRCDAQRPGRTGPHRSPAGIANAGFLGRAITDQHRGVTRRWDIDMNRVQELALRVEHLDSAVATI